jgi:DNA-directed RNA polymerase specialized sigma subunit
VPDVHLTEFTHALSHGEILLMIDVSASRVARIEKHIHQKYTDAYGGGVSWTVDALGL